MPPRRRPASPSWRRPGERVPVFRWLLLLALLGAIVCFALYAYTGERRWRALGTRIFKWTVVAGLVFFAVLIFERVVELLRAPS